MAFRRSFRRRTGVRRAFSSRRRNPLRTREVREPKWNVSNFRFFTEFANANPLENIISLAIMNPSFQLEGRGDNWETSVTTEDVQGQGAAFNQLNAIRGVKVGGIVWTSHFTVQAADFVHDPFVIAHAVCEEFLVTERVDDDGLPVAQTRWQETWRPITVTEDNLAPQDGDGGLVRIHRRRMTLMPIGSNATHSESSDALSHFNPTTSTVSHPNWGGAQSMRLRHWIPEEQQLAFHIAVNWSLDPAVPIAITHSLTGHLYWRLGRG